ncbi:MAG: hypothetical protein Q7S51_10210 [Gallionellaceae bacterium]|nr:hypothetical protein [Gallionellaceae bacterium]
MKKLSKVAIITVLLGVLPLLIAGGYAIYRYSTAEERQRDEQIAWAKEMVAAKLLDGESARFRNVRVGPIGVCGEVNGKNSYGAYTGFSRFHVSGRPERGTEARAELEDKYNRKFLDQFCGS